MSRIAVLLVDDEKTVLDALKGQVRSACKTHIVCETAESAAEAWEVLEELMSEDDVRVVLIVSDWLMPQVKGDEFLADVKGRYPAIRRVMLTGHADESALRRVQEEELAQHLLFKPWTATQLCEVLEAAFPS